MAVEYGGRVLEITVEIDECWMTVAMIGSWAMMEDWNDDERRLEELEPVAPCGGGALSLRDKALPVSAAYRLAGPAFSRASATGALVSGLPLVQRRRDCSMAVLVPAPCC